MWPTHADAQPAPRAAAPDGTNARVVMLLLPGSQPELFDEFDATQARCAEESDYLRLLRCVEYGCGSVQEFNARARLLLSRIDGIPILKRRFSFGSMASLALTVDGGQQRSSSASLAQQPQPKPKPKPRRQSTASSGGRTQSIFAALARIWVRAYALGLAVLALSSARAIAPALSDCFRR